MDGWNTVLVSFWVSAYFSGAFAVSFRERTCTFVNYLDIWDAGVEAFRWEIMVTLPKTNIVMENPPFWWYLQGNMGIFMGYVSFREGTMTWNGRIRGLKLFFQDYLFLDFAEGKHLNARLSFLQKT